LSATVAFTRAGTPPGSIPDGARPGRRAEDRLGDEGPEVLVGIGLLDVVTGTHHSTLATHAREAMEQARSGQTVAGDMQAVHSRHTVGAQVFSN